MRNLFTTKTVLAIMAFAVSIISPNLPAIQKEVEAFALRKVTKAQQPDVAAIISIVSALAGTGLATVAKYQSGAFYTPKGLPGRDKP